ncbi:hypothetical protein HFU75_03480, partial [Acidithiobacillus sp. VAN18-2]|nr:hypothetical protein [Acidithiobacillus sp. VAN18-2]
MTDKLLAARRQAEIDSANTLGAGVAVSNLVMSCFGAIGDRHRHEKFMDAITAECADAITKAYNVFNGMTFFVQAYDHMSREYAKLAPGIALRMYWLQAEPQTGLDTSIPEDRNVGLWTGRNAFLRSIVPKGDTSMWLDAGFYSKEIAKPFSAYTDENRYKARFVYGQSWKMQEMYQDANYR